MYICGLKSAPLLCINSIHLSIKETHLMKNFSPVTQTWVRGVESPQGEKREIENSSVFPAIFAGAHLVEKTSLAAFIML